MDGNSATNYKKFLLVGGAILGAAALIVAIFCMPNVFKNATVTILVAPSEATIYINGAEYHNGIYQMEPIDDAEITIMAPGFETKNISMDIAAHSSSIIEDYLLNEQSGLTYYKDNLDNYEILKLIAKDGQALNFIEEVEKMLGIRDYLPIGERAEIDGAFYPITITENRDTENCRGVLCLDAWTGSNANNEKIIKQFLQEKGFDSDYYQIFYHS